MTKEEILSLIDATAAKHGIPPALLRAQVNQESFFDPGAISECGAMGLLQLMPKTAAELGLKAFEWNKAWLVATFRRFARDAGDDRLDPAKNLDAGGRYLRIQYDHFPEIPDPEERWKFALASYNAGRGYINKAIENAKYLNKDWSSWPEVEVYLAIVGCDAKQVRNYVARIWAGYKGE